MEIKGLGLVSLIIIMYFLGLIMSLRIGRRIIRTFQAYLINVPVIGTLYGPAKQLVESFSGDSAAGFKRVVVVEYPKADTWMIGFLTGISEVNPGTTMGVVYLPTAPTPNSGWVAMIPIQQIYDTSMSVSEAMTMVLSGGISSPLELRLRQWTRRRPRLSSRKGAGPPPSNSTKTQECSIFLGFANSKTATSGRAQPVAAPDRPILYWG